MYKIEHQPTYYPIPYGLGVNCPMKGCERTNPNYCDNSLAHTWTLTDKREQFVYIHETRRSIGTKYLPEVPAYYHLKAGKLSDGEYLIARYYPQGNLLVKEGTEEVVNKDLYTFHGFLYTPEYVKVHGPKPKRENPADIHLAGDIDFNF